MFQSKSQFLNLIRTASQMRVLLRSSHWRCSIKKKLFLKILQYLQNNICVELLLRTAPSYCSESSQFWVKFISSILTRPMLLSHLVIDGFNIFIFLNSFSSNVPLAYKPGSWFLRAKCLKSTYGRVTF